MAISAATGLDGPSAAFGAALARSILAALAARAHCLT